ncbi:MAG: peptidoglycan DD-metalloendopeptidase family protein [Magnetococcales bacterium]|nr:peptidoglycan DD-metalloendopeptidase family protein [Magnetococcales bacterium]NGZ05793.1 peptidoglycan DD-metalloendopeptidase family protein [Magnetococcales bacterium]
MSAPADPRIGGSVSLRSWLVGILAPVVLMSGCTGNGAPAQVSDRTAATSPPRLEQPDPPTTLERPGQKNRKSWHTVRSGETLWAIATMYNLEVEELAAWNRISRPDQLRAGQRLRIAPPGGIAAPVKPDKPTLAAPDSPLPPSAQARPVPGAPSIWVWPHSGPIIARFGQIGPMRNPGIDIAVTPGDRVVAAADGVVAYADQGLTNFGNMILLRHGSSFMSAYAHLERILVRQGQSVRAGETIALAGQTGVTPSPRLHFEIRRSIAPQNPLIYLPRRE